MLEIFSEEVRASTLTEAEAHLQCQILTFKFRLHDKRAAELDRQARAVNYVFNFCNETQKKAAQSHRKWLGYHDFARLTAGASKDLNLHAHTIQRICREYAARRDQVKKPWLRWRGRKSLGWVPFNTGHVTFDGETFTFRGVVYQTMHLRKELKAGIKIGAGSFNADARGRWYLNVPVKVQCAASAPLARVGVDLGLKALATLSTGEKIVAPRFYRAARKGSRRRNAPAKRRGALETFTRRLPTAGKIFCIRRRQISRHGSD